MQNWTNEMWQAAGIGLFIGLVIGYFVVRFTKDSVKKQIQTETELQKAKMQLDSHKEQLEKHFSESAALLKNMAQDYQKLYQHLAKSSSELLPDLPKESLFAPTLLEQNQANNFTESDEQPRDYSEGSSGLLKEPATK